MVNKVALFFVPFFVSFVVTLWQHLRVFDTKILFIFDSGHYLYTASQIVTALTLFCSGRVPEGAVFIHTNEFVSSVMMDGPILPGLAALTFLLMGLPASATSWVPVICVLTFLNATTAGTISLIASRLGFSFRASIITALVFGCYPATVVSSGRFLTEPVATCDLLLLCLVSSGIVGEQISKRLYTLCATAGLLGALGLLTKPALIPLWLGIIGLAIAFRRVSIRKRFTCAVFAVLGAAMLLGPWLFLTKTLTGQFHLIPERVPSYNFAVGNNLNTDGRASLPPEPQAVRLSALNAPLKILKAAWSERPVQLSNLYVRKVPRILGFVWNDFRQNVFGLDINKQNFVHGIILAMAFMGLAYIAFDLIGSVGVYDQQRRFCLVLIPIVLVIHVLLYLPFEAITRYGATAQPVLFLAAALGAVRQARLGKTKLFCSIFLALIVVAVLKLEPTNFLFREMDFGVAIFVLTILKVVVLLIAIAIAILLGAANSTELSKLSQPRKVIVSLLICGVLFLIITPVTFTCLFRDDQRECLLELLPGEILDREFLATGDSKSLSNWLVYIDCDGRFEDAQFWVNGHKLSGQLVSANRFDSARYYLYNVARMYSSILDLGPDNLRQWRVLKIPAEFISSRPGAATRLTVKAGALGLTIYADRYASDEDQIFLPDRKYFGSTRLSCGAAALEPRLLSTLPTPLFDVPAGLNSQGAIRKLIGSQPRFYALRAVPSSNLEWLKREFSVPLSAKSFPSVMQSSEGVPGFVDLIKLDRYIFKLSPTTSLTTRLPAYFANNMPIEIILNGQIRSTGRVSKAGVFVTMHGNRVESTSMILPSTPPFVSASSSWKPFVIRDQVFVERSHNDDALLTVTVFPGRWEQISQYGLDRTVGSFQFKELSLLVRSLEPFDLNQTESTLH